MFFLLSRIEEFKDYGIVQEHGSTGETVDNVIKTRKCVENYVNNSMCVQYATCLREGQKLTIKAEELTIGDVVEVKFGDRIPGKFY